MKMKEEKKKGDREKIKWGEPTQECQVDGRKRNAKRDVIFTRYSWTTPSHSVLTSVDAGTVVFLFLKAALKKKKMRVSFRVNSRR